MSESEQLPRLVTGRDVDVTALVSLFTTMLSSTRADILEQIGKNSAAAVGHWQHHEEEHKELIKQLNIHLEEAAVHFKVYDGHLAKEHNEQVAFDARVQPVKAIAVWLTNHWKDLAILLIAVAGMLGFIAERVAPG
jgi:hypothetical protein